MQVSTVGGGRSKRARARLDSQLLLYNLPPTEEITLEEFEDFAFDRLRVLKQIESMKARGLKGKEYETRLSEVANKYLPIKSQFLSKSSQDEGANLRKDHISHFILRLAYCQGEDLRRWFLSQECLLFRHRLTVDMTPEERKAFLGTGEMQFEMVSKEEKAALQTDLFNTFRSMPYSLQLQVFGKDADSPDSRSLMFSPDMLMHQEFYKVPFTEAVELVRNRHCFLRRGYAYLPVNMLIHTIVARFRSHLSGALASAFKILPQVSADNRLKPLLMGLSKQYVGDAFDSGENKAGEIKLEDLDKLAEQSFPMCMKQLHGGLKRDHKLRYGGRQQYGLFLKGIGLSLEDSLAFWQKEFTQIMSGDQFQKNYVYNIRHNYGKEGKRANYTPFSCQKIIMGAGPAPGEHHGCPFRHYSESHLKAALAKLRIKSTDITDIVENVKSMNYQVACRKHFEVTHAAKEGKSGDSLEQYADTVGNHPNAFFEASRGYYAAKNGKKVTKAEPGAGSSSASSSSNAAAPPAAPAVANDSASAMADGFENPDAMQQ